MHALAFLSARTRVAVLRLTFAGWAASLIARYPRSAFQRRCNVWKHIRQMEIVATSGNKFANRRWMCFAAGLLATLILLPFVVESLALLDSTPAAAQCAQSGNSAPETSLET
jgi:hypothetical protein